MYNSKLLVLYVEECSMASIVKTIIPDYQSINIKKKHFIKIVPTDGFT